VTSDPSGRNAGSQAEAARINSDANTTIRNLARRSAPNAPSAFGACAIREASSLRPGNKPGARLG